MATQILDYIREVLNEHVIPTEDENTVIVTANWLVDLLEDVESRYPNDQV